jgi:hypothetical protein
MWRPAKKSPTSVPARPDHDNRSPIERERPNQPFASYSEHRGEDCRQHNRPHGIAKLQVVGEVVPHNGAKCSGKQHIKPIRRIGTKDCCLRVAALRRPARFPSEGDDEDQDDCEDRHDQGPGDPQISREKISQIRCRRSDENNREPVNLQAITWGPKKLLFYVIAATDPSFDRVVELWHDIAKHHPPIRLQAGVDSNLRDESAGQAIGRLTRIRHFSLPSPSAQPRSASRPRPAYAFGRRAVV